MDSISKSQDEGITILSVLASDGAEMFGILQSGANSKSDHGACASTDIAVDSPGIY